MIFKVLHPRLFSIFCNLFRHSGPHFYSFFGDFRVAKAPVLELVGLIFLTSKKESKKVVRVFAVLGGGRPFKQDNIPPRGLLFNISALQRCLKAQWRIN